MLYALCNYKYFMYTIKSNSKRYFLINSLLMTVKWMIIIDYIEHFLITFSGKTKQVATIYIYAYN